MKLVLAFACSSAVALALAAVTPRTSQPRPANALASSQAGDSLCPPTVFECCDGTTNTNCSNNGGNCGVISVCGKPF
ncbi:MAG TPA: hypothetical protein VFL36_10345 [Myxococcales bacterium]|nr:hypothetical protein [Myxococcales bacterium]